MRKSGWMVVAIALIPLWLAGCQTTSESPTAEAPVPPAPDPLAQLADPLI